MQQPETFEAMVLCWGWCGWSDFGMNMKSMPSDEERKYVSNQAQRKQILRPWGFKILYLTSITHCKNMIPGFWAVSPCSSATHRVCEVFLQTKCPSFFIESFTLFWGMFACHQSQLCNLSSSHTRRFKLSSMSVRTTSTKVRMWSRTNVYKYLEKMNIYILMYIRRSYVSINPASTMCVQLGETWTSQPIPTLKKWSRLQASQRPNTKNMAPTLTYSRISSLRSSKDSQDIVSINAWYLHPKCRCFGSKNRLAVSRFSLL